LQWTSQFEVGQEITIPLKNADGGYICSAETLARIEGMSPTTLPRSFVSPAMSSRDPFGFTPT
jgi:hypothetical protein